MRYEDLLLEPEPVLIECFKFLLDAPTIEGTIVEKRIQDIAREGFASKSVYKLKTKSNDLMKNMHMYTEAQIDELKEMLVDYNLFCGYTNAGDEKATAFFNYEDDAFSEEQMESNKGFLKVNENTLANIGEEKTANALIGKDREIFPKRLPQCIPEKLSVRE